MPPSIYRVVVTKCAILYLELTSTRMACINQQMNSFNSNINVKRYNFRTNVDMTITPTTVLSLSLAGSLENRNYPGESTSSIFNYMQQAPPVWFPVRFPDPTKIPGYPYSTQARNPFQVLAFSGYATEYYSRVQSNMTLTQQLDFISKGLSAKFMYSFDANGSANIKRSMSPRPYMIVPWSIDANGDPCLLYTSDAADEEDSV